MRERWPRRGLPVVLVSSVLLAPAGARGAELDGNAQVVYHGSFPDAAERGRDDDLYHVYGVRVSERLTDMLRLDGSLRAEALHWAHPQVLHVEPNLALVLDHELVRVQLGFRHLQSRQFNGRERARPHAYLSLLANLGALPELRATANWDQDHGYAEGGEQEERDRLNLTAGARKTLGPVEVEYDLWNTGVDDRLRRNRIGATRHAAAVRFADQLLHGALMVDAEQSVSARDQLIRVASDGSTIYEPRRMVRTAAGIDTTPQDDGNLSDNPALADGDTGTGAGVDLSAGADWNLLADLGSPQTIDVVNVFVTTLFDAAQNPGFAWDVYTTDDPSGLVWRAWRLGAPFTFSPGLQQFSIPLGGVTARAVKVVQRVTAVGLAPLVVSELEVLGGAVLPGARARRRELTHTTTAGVRWQVIDRVSVAYNLLYDRYTDDWDRPGTRQLNHGGEVVVAARADLRLHAGMHYTRLAQPGAPRRMTVATLMGSWVPLPKFNTQLAVHHDWGRQERRRTTIDGGEWQAFAALYPGVDLSAAVGLTQIRQAGDDIALFTSRSRLALQITAALFARAETTLSHPLGGSGEVRNAPQTYLDQYSLGVAWRPTPSWHAALDLDWRDTDRRDDLGSRGRIAVALSESLLADLALEIRRPTRYELVVAGNLSWAIGRLLDLQAGLQRITPLAGSGGYEQVDLRLSATL